MMQRRLPVGHELNNLDFQDPGSVPKEALDT
jgi:hypothetical protein